MDVGTLYVVGTPIGNLSDMSPRALKTLSEVDFIAAEDTRVTGKLLDLFGIKKPLVSYHEHNKREKGGRIIDRLLAGESAAVVTDAGMPAISDPGGELVALCRENGIPVAAVPGPCAFATALSVSGLDSVRFTFEGFLSTSLKSRKEHLESLKNERRLMIFYEAPHKLVRTLEDFCAYFPGRTITLCRELTKIHEEVVTCTVEQALESYAEKAPKGEFVLLLQGAPEQDAKDAVNDAVSSARAYIEAGMSPSAAAKKAAADAGISKNAIYSAILGQNGK